jgi:ATP-dependent Clp protease protease subunit
MRFWNLTENAEQAGDGVLDIDGEIVTEKSWFTPSGAVVAKDFRKALAGVKDVTVRINSPGGDVMAGAEIYSALREHSLNGYGKVTVIVTALAASAASVIAMAGDRILMSPTAYMMIHNPWSVAVGDAHEMRKTARTLDVISEGLINAYQQRTGKSRDELKRMLDAETWMSAGTAVTEGFADGIYGEVASQGGTRAVACLMSAKAHGAQEIAARYAAESEWAHTGTVPDVRGEDPEEEDPEETEEPDEEEEEAENVRENADPEEEPDADPAEDDPDPAEDAEEEPNDPDEEDPEEPEEAPEDEDPEEEPEEEEPDEEEPDQEEQAKRAEISRRAAILAALY